MSDAFQLATTPLEPGTTLLEASAGTGKTFTIAGVFLRLILERRLSVREILVVTYTVAATEELRGRIRQQLVAAAGALRAGRTDDAVLQSLIAPHLADADETVRRLESALGDFDEAPIFTIHGFCQRMLTDRAFESGVLFDTELVTDQSALEQEIADDYWRAQFYQAGPVRVLFALKHGLGPDSLRPLLRESVSHPGLRLVSRVDGRAPESLAADLETKFTAARDEWRGGQSAIRALFGAGATWANKPFNRDDEMAELFRSLDECFSESNATPGSLSALEDFTSAVLREKTNKRSKTPAPAHRFFTRCDELLAAELNFLVGIKLDFFNYARSELPRRKAVQKTQSFDDLLTRLRDALLAPGGADLAAGIRAKFKAALIDEFQDTDPVQYGIFQRVFAGGESLLFLIGDPKQAIYGFRGADIFTYLEAAQRVDRRYTLGTNFRSSKNLVRAVNTVFSHRPGAFVSRGIEFASVRASGRADREPREMRETDAPLQIWFWPGDGGDISKGTVKAELPAIVATEITRLLNAGTKPENIAVLVDTNAQAQLMQDALTELRVPSVQHASASLFMTHEAREFHRVLAAIAQPGRDRLLRAALATDLCGATVTQLGQPDDAMWPARCQRFREYQELWVLRGFMPMFRQFVVREQVRQRLLEFPDGERRLTNLLHLGEVLHTAAAENRPGLGGLVKWLAEQRVDQPVTEEHQLRLERDDNAVQLVTIHKSKGLEYDIVFCPFLSRGSQLKRRNDKEEKVFFHDERAGGGLTRDLGPDPAEAHRQLAIRERLAENVRLLYVALTRARHRCTFIWGGMSDAGSAALAWLLHAPPADAPDLLAAMDAHFKALPEASLRADLEKLAARSVEPQADPASPAIAVKDLPERTTELYHRPRGDVVELSSRDFAGVIRTDWRIASFSWLTAGHREELPDHDSAPSIVREEEPASGIFALPRGTKAGTCLHQIFEKLDFTATDPVALNKLVEETLATHGIDAEKFAPAVRETVRRTLAVPLELARPHFALSRVATTERLTELEFCFPLKALAPAALAECFARHGEARLLGNFPAQLARLPFAEVRGHLKGFIDLAFRHDGRFYIADWKSNHLGNLAEDYAPDALAAEMRGHLYLLQYHIYVVALHRYLALRLPGFDYERDFGGVFYLFLRGIDPARPELGVFRDRPSLQLITALEKLLIAAESGAAS